MEYPGPKPKAAPPTAGQRDRVTSTINARPPLCGGPLSLLRGVEAVTCKVLQIENLRHKSALIDLGEREEIPEGSVAAALDTLAANWKYGNDVRAGSESRENWRWWAPQSFIAPHNRNLEIVLERAIARACVAQGRRDWANQIPIASGVMGSSADRRRAIDLVQQRGPHHFAFIELKIASDTPLYAAFEIITYVGIWLLSRATAKWSSPLLDALRVDARVLAPASYYSPFALGLLQQTLDRELAVYGSTHGVSLSFAFDMLPAFAIQPHYGDDEVLALIDGCRPI